MQVETDVILPQAFVNVVRNNDLDRHLTWQIGDAKQVVLSHAETKKAKQLYRHSVCQLITNPVCCIMSLDCRV